MTRNSTRSYWLTNENWYRIVDGKFQLTPDAPPAAKRSFNEWNKPPKMTFKKFFRIIRSKLF